MSGEVEEEASPLTPVKRGGVSLLAKIIIVVVVGTVIIGAIVTGAVVSGTGSDRSPSSSSGQQSATQVPVLVSMETSGQPGTGYTTTTQQTGQSNDTVSNSATTKFPGQTQTNTAIQTNSSEQTHIYNTAVTISPQQTQTQKSSATTTVVPGTEATEPTIGQTTTTVTPPPPQPPRCFNGFNQTVIFLALDPTTEKFYPFLQGGFVTGIAESCPSACETPHCSVDVTYLDDNVTSAQYEGWRERDTRLNWEGAETDQGTTLLDKGFAGQVPALGTPLVLSSFGHPVMNRYGNNYFMVDLCIDCRYATSDWLQVRALWYDPRDSSTNREVNITQPMTCSGNVPVSDRTRPNVESTNHFARCGFVNVFSLNDNDCTIDYIVN